MVCEGTAKLARTVFDTTLISPEQRAAAMQHRFHSLARLVLPDARSAAAALTCFHLDAMRVSRFVGTSAAYERDDELIHQSHFDDHIFLQLIVRGDIAGTAGNKYVAAHAGDIYVIDLTKRSRIEAADGEYISVLIPRDVLCGDQADLHGYLLPRGRLRCRMLTIHLERLLVILAKSPPQHAGHLVDATIATIRNCLQLRPPGDTQREPWNDMLRQRILGYIEEHLPDTSLDADTVRRAFRISRAHLYRLFPDYGGIQRYIRNKRLDAAFKDLCTDPYQRIAAIVERHGFSSERQFQRAFHERFEMPPSELRLKHRNVMRR